MPRPIWKGQISFGLVNIPITLYSAESRTDLHFKLIDSRNDAGIRYERVNEVTGEEVPWDQIVKGYEHADGEFVLLNDEDFKRAAPEASRSIDIVDFVPESAIPPEYFDKPYYIVPAKKADKAYALLRETMRKSERVAVANVVIRTRQYVAAILVRERALVLELLRYHQELRDAPNDELPSLDLDTLKLKPKEIEMAQQLVDAMAGDWDPSQYKDEYRSALMAYIDDKVAKGSTTEVAEGEEEPEESGKGKTIDIMALLKKSMEERKKEKAGGKK